MNLLPKAEEIWTAKDKSGSVEIIEIDESFNSVKYVWRYADISSLIESYFRMYLDNFLRSFEYDPELTKEFAIRYVIE